MGETSMAEGDSPRPSISSVDARVGRLEEAQARLEGRQLEQDGVMKLIQLEQTHIREIMTSRFVSLESSVASHGTKLDSFIGRMEALISDGMKQSMDLKESPLGRQVDARLVTLESEQETQKIYRAEQRGMWRLVVAIGGSSLISLVVSVVLILKTAGVL